MLLVSTVTFANVLLFMPHNFDLFLNPNHILKNTKCQMPLSLNKSSYKSVAADLFWLTAPH